MKDALIVLFAIASGLSASGIVANLYRILGRKPETLTARAGYFAVMTVAGPSVLFDKSIRHWRAKGCSSLALLIAVAVSGYWSFAIGLLVLSLRLGFH
jgi:hypothetical protein